MLHAGSKALCIPHCAQKDSDIFTQILNNANKLKNGNVVKHINLFLKKCNMFQIKLFFKIRFEVFKE